MNVYLREVIDTFRSAGFLATLRHSYGTLLDYYFDLKHGTETFTWINLSDLKINSTNTLSGSNYRPSRVKPFYKLFRSLNLPKDAGFVDFGSGKGRTLIMAMEVGFERVVGVEFSPELCEIARRNVAVYLAKRDSVPDVVVIECDVVDYDISPSDQIFYLANPFDDTVLHKMWTNICNSIKASPRNMWIIYHNPVHHDIIKENTDIVLRRTELMFNGCRFFVYDVSKI